MEILDGKAFELTLTRLCYELIENHNDFSNSAILGIQPRGTILAKRIHQQLSDITGNRSILLGALDVTFYRDDIRQKGSPIVPNQTDIPFIIEGKKVVLIDDVLYTGRTIRSAMDAMLAFGRPELVELLVLIDRRYSRHLPIQANYIGKKVDTISTERVKVEWKESSGNDRVMLVSS